MKKIIGWTILSVIFGGWWAYIFAASVFLNGWLVAISIWIGVILFFGLLLLAAYLIY